MNTSRIFLEEFLKQAADSADENTWILDAGAGRAPYKNLFGTGVYSSTDHKPSPGVEHAFISDLSAMPIADEHYDMVVCTQVLEHVAEPQRVLREFYRILRPGGSLWLTTPLFFEEHETPNDYFRYTRFGLEYLFETSGFEIRQIDRLEGYFMTLAYQLRTASQVLPLSPSSYNNRLAGMFLAVVMAVLKPLFYLLYVLFSRLDYRFKRTDIGYPKNYAVIGIKPRT